NNRFSRLALGGGRLAAFLTAYLPKDARFNRFAGVANTAITGSPARRVRTGARDRTAPLGGSVAGRARSSTPDAARPDTLARSLGARFARSAWGRREGV